MSLPSGVYTITDTSDNFVGLDQRDPGTLGFIRTQSLVDSLPVVLMKDNGRTRWNIRQIANGAYRLTTSTQSEPLDPIPVVVGPSRELEAVVDPSPDDFSDAWLLQQVNNHPPTYIIRHYPDSNSVWTAPTFASSNPQQIFSVLNLAPMPLQSGKHYSIIGTIDDQPVGVGQPNVGGAQDLLPVVHGPQVPGVTWLLQQLSDRRYALFANLPGTGLSLVPIGVDRSNNKVFALLNPSATNAPGQLDPGSLIAQSEWIITEVQDSNTLDTYIISLFADGADLVWQVNDLFQESGQEQITLQNNQQRLLNQWFQFKLLDA
ncbi:hypothetical protein NP233_g2418 [Leucocoprinus birnbaumii]|uniref:Uncharacterized protein n=1 Tax=Leucocoprinus birnbaumii TaxID=56174 RepID=A0AAD5YXB4_9AGAR|nr:hypothetical protein NP233_g2418 [Leucocoprinus birnbaumii]